MATPPIPLEKPQNGFAGLKHWRQDLVAGLVVSLISLPFSLGIALASGAPPICGLISAIVAGLILPFVGGSFVTVSGPAAGLAPVLLASTILLGRGDLAVGYPLLLVAICFTGVAQIILARFRAAKFSAMFPASVVEGMLAAIGLLIIAKQLPLLVGHKFQAHDFWEIVGEAPSQLLAMDPKVFFLGVFCLALIFAMASLKSRWLKVVPPQVIAAVVGLILGQLLGLKGDHLIHIPDEPFKHGIVLPNFQGLMADRTLWWALAMTVVTLTLIDGVESLATIAAIDKIDPFRRKSDPNRTLLAMGVSNLASSLVGGLTIIPGGVKSTACIVGGGRTQWANFYNACFLIIYILLGRSVINLLPLSALGAIVIYMGYKLCGPKVWKHTAHLGAEQLLVFATTVLVTVSTDLLIGIGAGIAAKLVLEAAILTSVMRGRPKADATPWGAARRWLAQTGELFRNPVLRSETVGGDHHLYLGRPVVCFNLMHLDSALAGIPRSSSSVNLHVTGLVTLVDHTAASTLMGFVDDYRREGLGVAQIVGLDRLGKRSHAESGLRVSQPVSGEERAEALAEPSRLGLARVGPEDHAAAAFLDRVSLTAVGPVPDSERHVITRALIQAGRHAIGKARAALAFFRTTGIGEGVVENEPDLAWRSLGDFRSKKDGPEHGLSWFSLERREDDRRSDQVDRFSLCREVIHHGLRPAVLVPVTVPDEARPSEEDGETAGYLD